MNKRVLLFISILAMSNLMCLFSARGYDQEHSFTKTKPQKEQLAGKYFPTLETISLIKDKGHYSEEDISITVYSNETFEIVNMPDWWIPNNAGFGKSNGGMTQEQENGRYQVHLDFGKYGSNLRLEHLTRSMNLSA